MTVVVLTGSRQAGKTTACQHLADLARAKGWSVAGVLSPAQFEHGKKTGIDIANLRTGDVRHLASRYRDPRPDELGYQFDEDALAWANAIVSASTPCDLLIVDELGPLEIEHNRGLTAAFDVLRSGEYRLAVVVVRPELIEGFLERLALPCEVKDMRDFAGVGLDYLLKDTSSP